MLLLTALTACWLTAGCGQRERHATADSTATGDSVMTAAAIGKLLRQGMAHDKAGRYAQAARCYRLAAMMGDDKAQNNLGVLYKDGQGVSQDYAEAARWFSKAARKGNVLAQSNLAWLFQNGLGVEKDYPKAMRLYRQCAARNHAAALNNLGTMFLHGMGVPCDSDSALHYFTLAAEQGLPIAVQNKQRLEN